MLSSLIGPVDNNGASVLIAIVGCICIITTSLIVKRRSRADLSNDFELAKIKADADNRQKLYALETDRVYKFKQIEQNLITSHKCEE